MSPVIICFGALDAAIMAQAAYAVKELSSRSSTDSERKRAAPPRD